MGKAQDAVARCQPGADSVQAPQSDYRGDGGEFAHESAPRQRMQPTPQKQLESMNKEILRTRAMNLRDALNIDSSVPRHVEGLVEWMLKAQDAVARATSSLSL